MERLLDAPRLYEDAKQRYILALEAQRKSQTLVISNAQRKLVHNFRQKLKTSATITKSHQAWRNETDIARHGYRRKGKERDRTAIIDGLQARGNIERPLLNEKVWRSKLRPKTTGATTNQFSGHFEKEITQSLQQLPKNTGNELVLRDFEQNTNEVNGEMKAMIGQNEGSFPSRISRRIDFFQNVPKKRGEQDRELLTSDLDRYKMFSKSNIDTYADMPMSNEMPRKGKEHREIYVNVHARNQTVTEEKQFSSFGTGHLERCKVVAPHVVTNYCREMIVISERDFEMTTHTRNAGERRRRSNKYEGRKRKDSGKTETDSSCLKSSDCEGEEDGWKRPSVGTHLLGTNTVKSNSSTSLSSKQQWQDKKRLQTAPDAHSTSQNQTKGHLKRRGKALSIVESSDCSNGSEEFRNNRMSYEMRTWIYDIRRDVKRAQCPEADGNHDSKLFEEPECSHCSLTNEKSTKTSEALEKFEAIFNDIYIHDHDGYDAQNVGLVEKLDTAALYSKSAVADSQKRTKKTWNLRDPRNQKLQPNIIL